MNRETPVSEWASGPLYLEGVSVAKVLLGWSAPTRMLQSAPAGEGPKTGRALDEGLEP